MDKSVEELLREAGDQYQSWYDAISDIKLSKE